MASFVFANVLRLGGNYRIFRRCDYAPRKWDGYNRAERKYEEGEELPLERMEVSYEKYLASTVPRQTSSSYEYSELIMGDCWSGKKKT
jgi:hypothetical protein